ncbi:MAG TPA: thioesterase family protein [Chroococcidiopsis sp.]
MPPFTTQLRVPHYKMDAFGHINNAVYQHYLEQSAIEHAASLGFSPKRCLELGGTFIMRRVVIDYLSPTVGGDRLAITTWLKEMRGSRAIRAYEIRRNGENNPSVIAEALWIWVDGHTMRPRAIPGVVVDAFARLPATAIV